MGILLCMGNANSRMKILAMPSHDVHDVAQVDNKPGPFPSISLARM